MNYSTPTGNTHSLYRDMLKQTHILIAGATGSGKSVIINGIISTAIHKLPCDVQFILIDPKRVELVEYKNLPHTLIYASEPDDMVSALQRALILCDIRYKSMQTTGCKKYQGSHTYVIIDELADLMTTDKKRVMPLIQRLCQIGRAAGISVIASTQCPLATVISTPIKVNFDTRVGLHTVTAQHSRNITEANGCEKLPRYGQAYYITPEGSNIVSVPMVDDAERARLIKFWKDIDAAENAEEAAAKPTPQPKRKGLFARLFA